MTSYRKDYGNGIKYDPITNEVHFISLNANLSPSITMASSQTYVKLNLATGAI